MKRQIDRTLKNELPRLVGAQCAAWRSVENYSERMKGWSLSKNNTQLWMAGDRSKVRCYKEQYSTGTWNESRQGGSDQTGDEVNVDILGIS